MSSELSESPNLARNTLAVELSLPARWLVVLAVAFATATLLIPVVTSGPAALTSDESLYLAEAYNIAEGRGPAYPSGEIVTHRPPLFPAILAAPIRLAGGDADAGYLIPKLIVLLLVVATFLVAREAFDWTAGVAAALLVASSQFLRWLGTTLFLDGMETLFLLLYLVALLRAFREGSAVWFGVAGLLIGAAFWTKEAAILWLPLPVIFALLSPSGHTTRVRSGTLVYFGVSATIVGAWWAWVYAVANRIYMWDASELALLSLAFGASAAVVAWFGAWRVINHRSQTAATSLLRWYGAVFCAAWCVGMLVGLEIAASWPYPLHHVSNVPRYLIDVAAPNSQPWPLLLGGLVWVPWRARNNDGARLLTLAFLLFLPFALHTANRSLSYRDALPLVYIAYIAAGALIVWLLRQVPEQTRPIALAGAIIAAVLFGALQTQKLNDEWLPYDHEAVTDANWDNPLVVDTAAWVNTNVPEGATIMSSRLYFTQIYVLDGAEHPSYQLPTVRVEPAAGEIPFLTPVSTLFRWEDHTVDAVTSDDWLSVKRFPRKDYYVGLSEEHLLHELRERKVDYLVLAGTDAAFSSLSYVDYFDGNAAFDLLHKDVRDKENAVYVYHIDRAMLASQRYRPAIDADTLRAISRDAGLSIEDASRAIDSDGVTTGGPAAFRPLRRGSLAAQSSAE